MKSSRKVYIVNGEEYVEHNPSKAEQLFELATGFAFVMLPICLIIGCILPIMLP